MLYCRCESDSRVFYAIVEGETIQEISAPPMLGSYELGARHSLSDVRLLPPTIPNTFFAAGFNYAAHVEDNARLGFAPARASDHPEVGYRANSALIGGGATIVKPADVVGRFEAEGELVAVIGATLRNATPAEARAGVFGWTIGNDVSAREWQHADRTLWRSKNSDSFKPMGPWIVTDIDALAATTTITVNGEVKSTFATGDMIFDPYAFIVEITKYITMLPGDVLWMGAQGAVAIDGGDTVDIAISEIGTLSNPVVSGTQVNR
jgi:2-keto-4-pentenoate hydratase/2-oxohepta-3-ene-1,7-dioic acid hydratase in catechol pathway